jgi:hypothetical protein
MKADHLSRFNFLSENIQWNAVKHFASSITAKFHAARFFYCMKTCSLRFAWKWATMRCWANIYRRFPGA